MKPWHVIVASVICFMGSMGVAFIMGVMGRTMDINGLQIVAVLAWPLLLLWGVIWAIVVRVERKKAGL